MKLDTSAKVLTVASATVYELLIKPTTLDTRVDCPFVDDYAGKLVVKSFAATCWQTQTPPLGP